MGERNRDIQSTDKLFQFDTNDFLEIFVFLKFNCTILTIKKHNFDPSKQQSVK